MIPLGVMVAGAAGQGAAEVADLLTRAALAAGYEGRRAVARPLSRFAGSVLCQVRFGRGEVSSPFIADGDADLLLALDRVEALRRIHDVKRGGFVAVSDSLVLTPAMRAGLERPTADVTERLREHVPCSVEVGAAAAAKQAGLPAAPGTGVVLLGLAAPLLPIDEQAWESALLDQCKPGELAAWRRALAAGRNLYESLPPDLRPRPAPCAA